MGKVMTSVHVGERGTGWAGDVSNTATNENCRRQFTMLPNEVPMSDVTIIDNVLVHFMCA